MAAGAVLAPAAGAQTQSSDASLDSLSIESDRGYTRMFPEFDSAVDRYDVAVPSGETEVTVSVAPNHPGATLELRSSRSGSSTLDELEPDSRTGDYTLELRADSYTHLNIDVTAEDGTEKKYYVRIEVASSEEKGWRVYNDVPMDRLVVPMNRLVDGPQLPSHYIRGLWAGDSADGPRVLTTASRHGTKDGEFYLDRKLYAFDAADSSRLPDEEFVLSGSPDAGIWSDGTTLWALDSYGALRAYDLSDGSENADLSADLTPNRYYDNRDVYEPRGIWSDGDTLWVTGKDDADNAKVFAFALPTKCSSGDNYCRKSNLDFELSGDNDNPWGITGNNDTWWVTEVGESGWTTDGRTIYAYNRSDGTRDADKDIDLLQLKISNIQQLYYGLAATDTIMYVAEYITGRVYSFSMPGVSGPLPGPVSDASLKSLSLSPGTLSDTFMPGQTFYQASVDYGVTSTTVTAEPSQDAATAVVKQDGVVKPGGVVALDVGNNTITVEVTAEDGETMRTYRVVVTPAGPSEDATLDGLTLSGVLEGNWGFMSDGFDYDVGVDNGVTSTTVTATLNDSGAEYVVQLDGVTDEDRMIELAEGVNEITVVVTAEDGRTAQPYTVTVTRKGPPPSSDASLSALSLSWVSAEDLGFMSDDSNYDVTVAHGLTETMVEATTTDAGASYGVNFSGSEDTDRTIELVVGANVITVVVTAADGLTMMTYTVTVNRESAPASDDATLWKLELSDVTLSPVFDPATEMYTPPPVANGVTSTTVTAIPNHADAEYVVKLDGVDDLDGTVGLDVGDNVITVVVTAADDATIKTYKVTVNRAASTPPPSNNNGGGTSNPGNNGGGGGGGGGSGGGGGGGDADDESSTTVEESDTESPYTDAGDADPDIETAIKELHPLGVFTGTECEENRICPNDPLTRWVAAVWMVRILDGEEPAAITESRFSDVNASPMWEESMWFAPHVERLAELEITVGCATDPLRYCPDGDLTRAQVASWIARAFDLPSAESAGFTDTVGDVHEDNIDSVVAAGIASGCDANPDRFCPDRIATRGELARMVNAARKLDSSG